METHSKVDGRLSPGDEAFKSLRTTLAYSILLLGLAASISAVPILVWAIVSDGFR